MEVAYNEPKSTQSLTYNEQRPQQMEIAVRQPIQQQQQTIAPKQAISHTSQKAISHAPQQQHTPQQDLTYNKGSHQQMDFTQPINYNQNIHMAQENMQIEPYQSQPAEIEKYNPNKGKLPEVNKFFCTLCQTPTYYDTFEKL